MSDNYLFVTGKELINFHSNRSSIQIYTIYEGKLYFLLGLDSRHNNKLGNLGDFGGTPKNNENSAMTAIREFNEESKLIFGILGIESFFEYFSIVRQGPFRSKNRKCGPNASTKSIAMSKNIKERETKFKDPKIDSEMTITFIYVESKWLIKASKIFNETFSDKKESNE